MNSSVSIREREDLGARYLVCLMLGVTSPALVATTYIPLHISIINMAILAGLAVLFSNCRNERPWHLLLRSFTVVAMVVVVMVIIGDAANYRIKGEPVNFYFWEMLSWTTLRVYLLAFPRLLLLCAFIILLPLGATGVTFRRTWNGSRKLALLFILTLSVVATVGESSPKHILYSYFRHAKAKRFLHDLHVIPPNFTVRDDITVKPGKNIVWIYVESFNKAMADEAQFPGLMPYMSRAADDGISLQSLAQIPGQQGSLRGILATQCGRIYDSKIPPSYDVCLGHLLHRAGYHQVFLEGADLAFEEFREAFQAWDFDESIGEAEIAADYPQYADKKTGWGYLDDVLFDLAYQKYAELSARGVPFHLAIFTLDTHDGTFDQDTCTKNTPYTGPGKNNRMVQAFHCNDMLLKEFMDKISKLPAFANTIVVVVGDHMMHETLLQINSDPDKIFGAILNANTKATIEEPTTHMDFAPTVLSLAGVQTNATFLDGSDWFGNTPPARRIDFSLLPDDVKAEIGIVNAPPINDNGIIYKHTPADVYSYVHEQESPFQETDGIRAYLQETQSSRWTNMIVLLESSSCESLSGLPYLQFSDQESHQTRLEYAQPESDIYRHDTMCLRLLSGYSSRKAVIRKIQVGLIQQNDARWTMDLR